MKKFTNFKLNMYTDILFGKGTASKVAQKVRQHGGSKVMLVYGEGSIKKSGLFDIVTGALNSEGIPFVEFGGVRANPYRSEAYKALELAKKENVDFLLGVGGGSVIDTAKAIALGLDYEGDIWDFYSGRVVPTSMRSVGAVNTIAAAGSETSGSTVLVDDMGVKLKKAIMYPDVLKPKFAIMDPELTYSVPAYQTAAGAVDIFSHTFERFFVDSASFLGDEFAAGVLRTVVKYAPVAIEKPDDYEARAELMLAASMSHNDITGIGRSGQAMQVHGMEMYLSGHYDNAHGAGLSMLMPAWLDYVVQNGGNERLGRIAQFAVMVFDVQPDMQDTKGVALEGIRRFRAWLKSIGMPLSFADLGIPAEDLPEMVKLCRCNDEGILKGFLDLDKKAVEDIYRSLA
jgi:alcohol dehydrogenase YqhD (iron-dependent ADH family)